MKLPVLLLLLGGLWAWPAYTQQQPLSSAPADSSRRFDLISTKLLQAALSTASPDSGSRARAYKMHSRFEGFWQNRYTYDVPEGRSVFAPIAMGMKHFFSPANPNSCLGGTSSGNWSYLGPRHNFYGQAKDKCGRVVSLWVDPGWPNYILAGSASGGLFRTVDGGQNWANITDNSSHVIPGTMGVTHIAVHPANPNFIYLATGLYSSFPLLGDKFGFGLVYSADDGTTWHKDEWFEDRLENIYAPEWETHDRILKLAYSPYSHKLYAIYQKRIYVRNSNTATPVTSNPWTDITPSMISSLPGGNEGYYLSDFEFTQSPQGSIIFSTNCVGATNYLFKYNETTQQWQSKAYSLPGFQNLKAPGSTTMVSPEYGVHEIALNPSDEVYLLGQLRRISDNQDKYFLYRYNWSTDVLTPVDDDVAGYKVASRDVPKRLVISRHNANRMYLTDCSGHDESVYKSEDGGASFQVICATHADGRVLLLHTSTNSVNGTDDVLYCGTDGGVAKKAAGSATFTSISGNGLGIAEMYGVTSSPSNDGILVAGAVDNGTHSWTRHDPVEPWKTAHWSDGLLTAMARNGNLTAFSQWQGNNLEPGTTHESQGGINLPVTFNLNNGTMSYGSSFQPREFHQSKWWKPIQFDALNTVRVGYYFVWKKSLNPSENWEPAFGTMDIANEPKPGVGIQDDTEEKRSAKRGFKPLLDYIISEQDPNIGYIAYMRPNWDAEPDGRYNDLYGKLFYSENLTDPASLISWTNVTPPFVRGTFYQINDIEINPQQPRQLWVAYGAAQWGELTVPAANRKRRVSYHADFGNTTLSAWQDRSAGLPPMPINKLLYVEGSDEVLFAGTDVGVYRWNKAAQRWECFNNGIPRGMVTNMELNYCSGKLRATIFGRGIWETDYADNMAAVAPGEVHTLSSNTTWNSSKTVSGSIRVRSGATLTISGAATKIYMARNSRILVEAGASLIVDGATLTNECGYFWKGLEIVGQAQMFPVTGVQGYLELRNGARIENAKEAIWNFSPQFGYQGGGIIKVSNSTFYNCWRAVALNHYPQHSYWYNGASQCSFVNTSFITDEKILQPPAQVFSSWNTLGGVVLRNCDFRNNAVPQQALGSRGTAIHIGHTGIQVEGSHFQGFTRGIYAEGISRNAARAVKIYSNTFLDNPHNITMAASSYGDIKGNTINYITSAIRPYGIYLDQTTGSYVGCNNKINGNYFGGIPNLAGEVGLIANLTRNEPTYVLNNQFNSLTVGAQTQQRNSKLYLSCNIHNANAYPWSINPQSTTAAFTQQGSSTSPAGNKFIGSQKDIYSYVTPVNIWSYYAGSGTDEMPDWQGNMNLFTLAKNSNCAVPMGCYVVFGPTEKGAAEAAYSGLVAAGERYSPEGRFAYGVILQAYNAMGDMDGLENFLQMENDVESNKLLIPLYIDRQKYNEASNTLIALHLPAEETNYYNLLIDLAQNNRSYSDLRPNEYQMLTELAADPQKEMSPYAKAYLELHYNIAWEHDVEALPVDPMSGKVKVPQSPDGLQSHLLDAAPNPATSSAVLAAFVNEVDGKRHAFIVVRDLAGAELYRSPQLVKGDNSFTIDVRKWQSGIYLLSLVAGTETLETKKLSIVH